MRQRTVRIALVGIAIVVAIAVAAAALLVATTPGARLAAAALGRFLPGLAIDGVEGTLLAGVRLEDLHYANDAFDARFERIRIVPDLAALATGRLALDVVDVGGGRIAVAGAGASAAAGGPPTPPALPASPVDVRSARLRDVDVTGAGPPFTIVAIDGRVAAQRIEIDALRVRTQALEADANGTLAWDADLSGTLGGTVTLATPQDGEPQHLRFAGTVALVTTADPWFARVAWTDLRATHTPAGDVTSGAGSLRVVLGAVPPRFELDADVAAGPLPDAAHLTAAATVAGADVALERLAVATLGGTIAAQGRLALDTWRGMLGIDIAGLDPAALEPRLMGRIDGHLDATLAREDGFSASIAGRIGGSLDGRPLDGRVRATYAEAGNRLDIERADVALGGGKIAVTGRVAADSVDLDATAHLPELADWYPAAHGTLTADAALSGPPRAPNVRLHATGERLALDAVPVALDRLTASVDGTLPDHHASLTATTRYGRLEAGAEEGWRDGKLEGRLLDATIELARAGRWRLTGPAAFTVAGTDVTLEHSCLDGPARAQLCAAVAQQSATVTGQRLPAALAAPWLPADVRAQGAATLDAMLDWQSELEGMFALRAPQLVVSARRPEAASEPSAAAAGVPERTEIDAIDLHGRLDSQRVEAHLSAAVPDTGGMLDGEVELAPPSTQGTLRGRLGLTIGDLAALDTLVAGIEGLHGSLTAELQATGTPERPSLRGRLDVEQLTGTLPSLGITVTDGRLAANAAGSSELDFDGRLCSDGCLALDGTLSSSPDWQLDARVRGDGFVAADTRDYHAVVAPRLAVTVDSSQARVTGSLAITKGRAVVDAVPRAAVRPASETVVHGRTAAAPMQLPLPLVAKISTHLDHARFEGLGIGATLDGDLDVEHTAEGQLLVQGTATVVDGTFSAYGQTLMIEQGQLIFSGVPDNPALDLRATRKVEDATIGLTITGTVRDPRSEIFSDPPLSESEALARLVTGHSLASAGSSDAATLERAAIGLGLKRALPSLERVGTNLGLSELGVEAGGAANGALVAGKQLGEDVYLRYKHGLFDDFSGLELIYRITEHLRLRTETGTAHSIDLIYRVARGLGNPPAGAGEGGFDVDRGKSAAEVAAPNQ